MHAIPRVLAEFGRTPWAIRPEALCTVRGLLERWAAGELGLAELQAAFGHAGPGAAERTQTSRGTIAVLPVHGILSPRIGSGPGDTSTERIAKQLRALLAEPSVVAIVLDIDSPGGVVYGVQELAEEIFQARSRKKILAVANPLSASAAYWIGRAAEELVVTPSGEVGSVGVYGAHEDWSRFLEMKGIKVSLVSAGRFKTEGNAYEPLSAEARAAMQASVDRYYADFIGGLARYAGLRKSEVEKNFGEGRMLRADDAVRAGMADRVGTLRETISRLAGRLAGPQPKADQNGNNSSAGASYAVRLRLAELG